MRGKTLRWWWRLHWLAWRDAVAQRPLLRSSALLLWWLPCVVLPVAASFAPALAPHLASFLVSIDVPLALLLAAGVVMDAHRVQRASQGEAWLWPHDFTPRPVQWLRRSRWLLVLRWPAGLAFATLLLHFAMPAPLRPPLQELWLISGLGLSCGMLFIWLMRNRERPDPAARRERPRRARGLRALSWAALHESAGQLSVRRLSLLALPAMLAAPAGAQVHQAMEILLVLLVFVLLVTISQESLRVQSVLKRWLAGSRLGRGRRIWWVWRHVALGAVMLLAAWVVLSPMAVQSAGNTR